MATTTATNSGAAPLEDSFSLPMQSTSGSRAQLTGAYAALAALGSQAGMSRVRWPPPAPGRETSAPELHTANPQSPIVMPPRVRAASPPASYGSPSEERRRLEAALRERELAMARLARSSLISGGTSFSGAGAAAAAASTRPSSASTRLAQPSGRRRRSASPPARGRENVVQRPRRSASPNPRARRALLASLADDEIEDAGAMAAALREKDDALRAFARLSSELIEIARPYVAPSWNEPDFEPALRRPTRRVGGGGGAPAWVP